MQTVIVTDVRYRTALAVIRPLAKAGYEVIAVQTRDDIQAQPAAFYSRYVSRRVLLNGSVKDADYAERLLTLCADFSERPVLFPIGADTLAMLSQNKERFAAVCDFLVSDAQTLDRANDKRSVAELAQRIGVPTPREYEGAPEYPVIIKPRCGEKLGLHAEQRYAKAENAEQFQKAFEKMSQYDPAPVVQELIQGVGEGVCLIMNEAHEPVSVICHSRIREYPISGGPSACCVSMYDEALVCYAAALLQALRFVGIAMVEFKGGKLLEINPRIWGSFPLTEACGSRFAENYVRAAKGEHFDQPDSSYRRDTRMRFFLNDTLACLSCLRHGRIGAFFGGLADIFRAREAIFRFTDQKPFWHYLLQTLRKGGGTA